MNNLKTYAALRLFNRTLGIYIILNIMRVIFKTTPK